MPRIVKHSATGPIKIDPSNWPVDAEGKPKAIFVCACGLSSKFPFCDGAHKACAGEEPEAVYEYENGTRRPLPPGDAAASNG